MEEKVGSLITKTKKSGYHETDRKNSIHFKLKLWKNVNVEEFNCVIF